MTTTTAATTATSLLDLHRSGGLPAAYPKVRELLADLSGADIVRAGQLLARLDPQDVLREHPATPAVTVAVTGHGTLSALVAPLTAELARHGLLLRPHLTDFDSYVFELSDPDSGLYRAGAGLTLCVLDPAVVFDELPSPWTPDDVERVLAEKLHLIEGLVGRFSSASRGTLVLNTLPLRREHTAQLLDHRSRGRLGAIWREANARLLRLPDSHASLVVIDLDPILADGVPAGEDRLRVYAKAHLSPDLLARYAREVGHLARHIAGATKKALVLDLDGTVWGGILGDDGPDGIEVADSYRGEAFRAFQRVVKQIGAQGVLLAAVSKNDLEPVREVFRDHPRMTLREDDFVQITANWRPKHDNLRELAQSLNLGVDSFVFVDDNPYECGLVRHSLPSVAVVPVDGDPALHVSALLRDGWFDTRQVTADDRARPARYRDDLVRQDFLQSFDSIADYLRELQVTVRFTAPDEHELARVSQLTLRTNQFNLTTERLQPADVRRRADDPDLPVLAIRSTDRFSDNGLVGVVFLRRRADVVHIDNFLLSCRVFSRGIEQACLAAVLRHARDTGALAVHAGYRPTAKNGAVRDFYPRNGFVPVGPEAGDGGLTTFRHDLADIPNPPEHVRLTASIGGTAS